MEQDAFFFMSGFLALTVLLRKMDKGNLGTHFSNPFVRRLTTSKEKDGQSALVWIPLIYFHRWMRIIPLYIYIVWIFMWLSPYLGSGPLWRNMADGNEGQLECREFWWTK